MAGPKQALEFRQVNRRNKRARYLLPGFIFVTALVLSGCVGSPSILSPQGPDAASVANLTWLMFIIAAVVFLGVLILLLVATLRKRRDPGQALVINPPNEHRTLILVVLFGAVLPAVVLIVVMGLSVSIDNREVQAQSANPALTIEVIGHQWWWEVRYPDKGVVTANEIHIPVGQPVEIKLTTADVIHSFWVPQLHGKVDMIPGQTNTMTLQADQVGNYRGECAEYCGTQHAKMDFLVVAQDQGAFNTWLTQQAAAAVNPPQSGIVKAGQQAFLGSSCTYCHTIRGTNASGTLGPDLTHIASRQTIGAGALPNTPGNLGGWITNAQAIKPGNLMPPMDLDPTQIQQILAYLETLK